MHSSGPFYVESVGVSSGCSTFLQVSKDMEIRWTGETYGELLIGVSVNDFPHTCSNPTIIPGLAPDSCVPGKE